MSELNFACFSASKEPRRDVSHGAHVVTAAAPLFSPMHPDVLAKQLAGRETVTPKRSLFLYARSSAQTLSGIGEGSGGRESYGRINYVFLTVGARSLALKDEHAPSA